MLLVNSNIVRPPVSPVGLEYVGEALQAAGIPVRVLDLAFEPDWKAALARELRDEPLAVGVAVRDTDDCSYATGLSFLPWLRELVAEVKKLTASPVVLGGGGYSVDPGATLEAIGADYGLRGDGEESIVLLCQRLEKGASLEDIPGLWGPAHVAPALVRAEADPARLPPRPRRLFDNPRYQREGGMVGLETKRGCSGACIYCADPVARGPRPRLRPPQAVVDEARSLLAQGVSWLHLSDSEFNLPPEHAREACRALITSGLGVKVAWYCYCAPIPFDRELAALMKRAGCAGVNFGVDSLDDGQLARLGRRHRLRDMEDLVSHLKAEGLNFIFDLLVGGPGETPDSVAASLAHARRLDIPLVGAAVGVRVYSGTPLAERLRREGWRPPQVGEAPDDAGRPRSSPLLPRPSFYVSPALGDDPFAVVRGLAGDDSRILMLAAPSQQGSYNYAGDTFLERAIANGARGAYWDILRRGWPSRPSYS